MSEQQPWVEIPKDTLYAFWKYDGPPFLGGTVTKVRNDGAVETQEFGVGHWFQPVVVVPFARGRVIATKLEEMRSEHAAAIKALAAEWKTKWRVSVRECGLPEPE